MTQKYSKKGIVTDPKTPSVRQRYCRDCPDSKVHSTGSQLWVSCKFQDGWRSINSVCNLPLNQKPLTLYSSKSCPRCKALKKWLRKHKVPFAEKNIDDTNVMASLVMRNLTVLSAPALETGDRVFLSNQIFGEDGLLRPDFLKREMQKQ